MAVLQNEILALLHLVHLVKLLLNPGHRVLGDTLGEGPQLLVDIALLRLEAEFDPLNVAIHLRFQLDHLLLQLGDDQLVLHGE